MWVKGVLKYEKLEQWKINIKRKNISETEVHFSCSMMFWKEQNKQQQKNTFMQKSGRTIFKETIQINFPKLKVQDFYLKG